MKFCRITSTCRQRRADRGFTLIEVLVVVAIIALLTAILIPSLTKARDQAKRAVCTSNLHQALLALASYTADHKSFLPSRGWFSNTYAESQHEAYGWGPKNMKWPINLGLLVGGKPLSSSTGRLQKKYLKDWDLLYCPNTYNFYYNELGSGVKKSLWDGNFAFTHGGYQYAIPAGSRTQLARMDIDVYSRSVKDLHGYWTTVLLEKHNERYSPTKSVADQDVVLKMMPRRSVQPVVMEFISGGGYSAHKGGFNVAYSDGHARYQSVQGPYKELINVANVESARLWYDMTVKP